MIVSEKLNNSLNISERGKKTTGTFSDLINPEDPIMLPIAWLVTLEKKNQKISPALVKMI
jgi:hypothetical protein